MTTTDQIQQLYITFFNRPADADGLAYWTNQVNLAGGNTEAVSNAFSLSPEYTSLFAGQQPSQIISTIYHNLFGAARVIDMAGLTYWSNEMATGALNVSTIANAIAHGAQGTDATAVADKVLAAEQFTNSLTTAVDIVAYETSGNSAIPAVKAWLGNVVDAASLQTAITAIPALNTSVVAGGTPNTTFMLTTGIDTPVASIAGAHDTYVAPVLSATGAAITTLNAGDVIVGNGTDSFVLNATATNNNVLVGSVSNVANITIIGSDNIAKAITAAQTAAVTAATGTVATATTLVATDTTALTSAQATVTADNAAIAAGHAADIARTAAGTALLSATNVNNAVAAIVASGTDSIDVAAAVAAATSPANDNGSPAATAVALAVVTAANQPSPTLLTVQAAAVIALATYSLADISAAATKVTADGAAVTATAALAADITAVTTFQTALTSAQASLVTDQSALTAAQNATNGNVDASFFVGSTAITVDGVATNVNKVAATQTVTFNGGAGLNDAVNYGSTVTAGTVGLTQSSGTITLSGAKLATATLSGTVLAVDATHAGTVTLIDGSTASNTISTLNLAITDNAIVDVTAALALTTIVSTSTSNLTLIDPNLSSSSVITVGTGMDTLNATLSSVTVVKPTISGVEALNLTFAGPAVFDASLVTGATALGISGDTAAATVQNLNSTVTVLATTVTNAGNNIALGYATATGNNLTYTIGNTTTAGAAIGDGNLTLTNVDTLAINAIGTHGSTIGDITATDTLTSLTLGTTTVGGDLVVKHLYSSSTDGLANLASITIAGNGGSITAGNFWNDSTGTFIPTESTGYGNHGATTGQLATISVSATNTSTVMVGDIAAYAVTTASSTADSIEASSLTAITLNADAASTVDMGRIYAGGDEWNNGSYGVTATTPSVAINLTTGAGTGIATAATLNWTGTSGDAYYGGSIASYTVTAGSYSTVTIGDQYVYGVGTNDLTTGTNTYVSGGNVGTVTVTAAANSTVDLGNLSADGSIGNVNVNLAVGASIENNGWYAGDNQLSNRFGSVGNVTVTAATGAGVSSLDFEANDHSSYVGNISTQVSVGNVSLTAGDNAAAQNLYTWSDGSTGNVSLSIGNNSTPAPSSISTVDSIAIYTGSTGWSDWMLNNGLDVEGYGTIGTSSLTVATHSFGELDVYSEYASVGASTINIGADSQGAAFIFSSAKNGGTGSTGAISATVDSNGSLYLEAHSVNGSVGAISIADGVGATTVADIAGQLGTGAVTASVAVGGILDINVHAGSASYIGSVTASGAGTVVINATTSVVTDVTTYNPPTSDLVTQGIGVVDASGVTGTTTIDLSGVTLGTTIKAGSGGATIVGTQGTDTIVLGTHALPDAITAHNVGGATSVAAGEIVTGFAMTDSLAFTSAIATAATTIGAFTIANGIATYSGSATTVAALDAAFLAAIAADNGGNAGIVAFNDGANTFVAYDTGVHTTQISAGQVVELVGVHVTSVNATSGTTLHITSTIL